MPPSLKREYDCFSNAIAQLKLIITSPVSNFIFWGKVKFSKMTGTSNSAEADMNLMCRSGSFPQSGELSTKSFEGTTCKLETGVLSDGV